MNAKEISLMLADRAEHVCMHLLPHGKKQGKRWFAGDVSGKAGNSLVVDLTGSKAGIWADFGDNGSDRGDLIELWRCTRGLSFVDAFNEAKAFLGVVVPELTAPKKTFTRPETPKGKLIYGDRLDYMINTRKINQSTLEKYKISVNNKNEILFPIVRNGELINIKYLTPRETPGEKNKWRQETNAEPCLFGWQGVTEDTKSIIITEGEIDALTLNQFPNITALSIPAGANNLEWLSYEYENLARFNDIVLMLDMDEAGQQHVNEIAQRLGLERTRIAKLPLKDANEMIVHDRLGELGTAIIKASHITPEELRAAREYQNELIDYFNGNLQEESGKTLPWSNTSDKVRQRPSELSIWTGINGHGKSQLLGYNMIGLIDQGEKVCIFSGEMKPRRTLERMVRQILGTANPTDQGVRQAFDFLDGNLWLFDVTGTAKANRLLEVFAYARKRYGITHFVIDSLMKCGFVEDDYNAQKQFVDKLCDFKNEHNIHIHLVAHPRKSENEKTAAGKMDVRGSGALTDLADNVYSVWRNKIKEEKVNDGEEVGDTPDAILYCNKQRNGEWEGKIALWFNKESLQYYDNSRSHHQQWIA